MAERTIERDEPVMDEQGEALRRAVDRAERAEAELAKLKNKATSSADAPRKAERPAAVDPAERQTGHHQAAVKQDEPEEPAAGESGNLFAAAQRTDAGDQERAEALAPRGTSSTARPDPTGEHLMEPGSMDRSKQPAAHSPEGHPVGEPEVHGIAALREDSMMAHLLDALDRGEDIGHYGRLTFAMISRHFLSDEEVIAELTRDNDFSEDEARQMLVQVEGRDYSPPRRERILEWQAEQEFAIIPDRHDPDCGNVYKSLRFPKQTYSHIGHYQEEKTHE